MGKTNRTASLEAKISMLLGEQEALRADIEKAEALVSKLPEMQDRLWETDELIKACSVVIKSDRPDWTPDHLEAKRKFVHKIPIKLGNATKTALDVLRLAEQSMTVREIAREVLRREGHETWTTATLDKVTNSLGNSLRRHVGTYLQNDGGWPARYWTIKPE
jgi:hypothetical protein